MTDLPEEIVEAAARGIYEVEHEGLRDCWGWDDSGLDDEHPGARAAHLKRARAALSAIPFAEVVAAARAAESDDMGYGRCHRCGGGARPFGPNHHAHNCRYAILSHPLVKVMP